MGKMCTANGSITLHVIQSSGTMRVAADVRMSQVDDVSKVLLLDAFRQALDIGDALVLFSLLEKETLRKNQEETRIDVEGLAKATGKTAIEMADIIRRGFESGTNFDDDDCDDDDCDDFEDDAE